MNFLKIASEVINDTHIEIASEPIVLFNYSGQQLTESIEYDIDGNLTTNPLMAVVSTLNDEMTDMALDGRTDSRKVDFIVNTDLLPEYPLDSYYILYNSIKHSCYQRDGQMYAGRFSDQYNKRFRIHTRREQ